MFFPELWSPTEKEEWGKAAFMANPMELIHKH
jgi:hypothetical protein